MTINARIEPSEAKKILAILLGVELTLVLIYVSLVLLGMAEHRLMKFFDLDEEANLPAWFSSIQLLAIGMLFLLLYLKKAFHPSISSRFVLFIAMAFIFLSLDEAASVHERVTRILKDVSWFPSFRGNHGRWVFIYAAVGALIAPFSVRHVMRIWKCHRREAMIIAFGIFLLGMGAVGLEVISFEFLRSRIPSIADTIEIAAEEFSEMAGASIILYGALGFLSKQPSDNTTQESC